MDISQLLQDSISETGLELSVSVGKAKVMIAKEGARLALAVGEPGFDMVLRASRDNIALQLGVDASLDASAADSRMMGIVQAVLMGVATA